MAMKLKKTSTGDSASGGTEVKAEAPKKKFAVVRTGEAAKKMNEEEAARVERAKEQAGKPFRFWISGDDLGEDFAITFVDGELNVDGQLELPAWREHRASMNGRPFDAVCTHDNEGKCPLCEKGDRPTLVHGLTIIDHTKFVSKKGPNAGKTIKDRRKMYVVKPKALAMLQKHAGKQKGLAGCMFEVSRSDDKSPATGDMFVPVEKSPLSKLVEAYGDQAVPIDFNEALTYIPYAELAKMPLVLKDQKFGGDSTPYQAKVAGDDDLEEQL